MEVVEVAEEELEEGVEVAVVFVAVAGGGVVAEEGEGGGGGYDRFSALPAVGRVSVGVLAAGREVEEVVEEEEEE